MTNDPRNLSIAGLSIPLHESDDVLAQVRDMYSEFDSRTDTFKADKRNPHLCAAGCSHCCKQGAVFAVTLAEAVEWTLSIEALPPRKLNEARSAAEHLLRDQQRIFARVDGPTDVAGRRDESTFSARISALNAELGPACPLLVDDLCSVYEARPMLCRAYGFPVDAYAVRSDSAIVFRSLCVLYEGKQLVDYVRAEDLKARLNALSRRIAGGQDVGRFTSIETILAGVDG